MTKDKGSRLCASAACGETTLINEEMLESFKNGLLERFRHAVFSFNPEDFEEAIKIAVRQENYYKGVKGNAQVDVYAMGQGSGGSSQVGDRHRINKLKR